MIGKWELKSIVFPSNTQAFEREIPIYSRYVEEPHCPRVVALTSNDSSYV
jgi:hypothetical protein